MGEGENALFNSASDSDGVRFNHFGAIRAELRRRLWIPLLIWAGLVAVPLTPFFLASYLLIGENGFHGVQVGYGNKELIHGSELDCKEGRPTRECTLVINGSLLEISAPLLGEFGTCEVRYEGEVFSCIVTRVTGENQRYPPEEKYGVRITGDKIEKFILAERNNWKNWRSRLLGVGRESKIITRQFSWATISLVLAFLVTPLFFKSTLPLIENRKVANLIFFMKLGVLFIALPLMYYLITTALIAFQFIL